MPVCYLIYDYLWYLLDRYALKSALHEFKGIKAYLETGIVFADDNPANSLRVRASLQGCHGFEPRVNWSMSEQGRQLRIPLLTMVDYCGRRAIACASLPIGKNTIRYGSDDGGLTIHAGRLESLP